MKKYIYIYVFIIILTIIPMTSLLGQTEEDFYVGTLHDAVGGGQDMSHYRGQFLKWPGGHEESRTYPGGFRSCSSGIRFRIIVRNWTDPDGNFYETKQAYKPETGLATPSQYRTKKYFRSMRTPTTVIDANGESYQNLVEEPSELYIEDHNLLSDEMIVEWNITDVGLLVKRTYYAWANRDHDDYIIERIVLKNTGNFDENPNTIEYAENQLPEVYCAYWSYVLLPCNKAEKFNSFDDLGDHDNYIDYYGAEPGDSIRIMYGWDGDDPDIPIDDYGDPFPERYVDDARYNLDEIYSVGEFLTAMYAGYGVLHVDKSAQDRSNDMNQPFTSGWTAKNEIITWENEAAWGSMFNTGNPYHMEHPDLTSSPVRYQQSFWMGMGSFAIDPGDSVTLVFVHAAKGPEIDLCKEMGEKWFYAEITEEERNQFLESGRDSLFKAVGKAQMNWDNYLSKGESIPMGPSQPQNAVYKAVGNGVELAWSSPDVGDVSSYRIYRNEGNHIGDYELLAEVPASVNSYFDDNSKIGVSYYYYITALNEQGIESSAHYNRMNSPCRPYKKHSEDITKVRVVPNPFNYYQAKRWSGERNRITFTNLSKNCTIRVFTVNGDLVKTFHHKSESATEHWAPLLTEDNVFPAPGVYVYVVEDEDTGDKETGKFIIIR